MAILIEEEKKKTGSPLVAFGWIAIAVIIVIAGYYVFLSQPDAVIVPPPAGFVALQPISQISVLPQDVASSTVFQSLRAVVPQPALPSPGQTGRNNPFIAP